MSGTMSNGLMRTVHNASAGGAVTFGVGRNWGYLLHNEDELYVHVLMPSVRVQAGFVTHEDVNETMPVTMGDAQVVGVLGGTLSLLGMRISSSTSPPASSGWMAPCVEVVEQRGRIRMPHRMVRFSDSLARTVPAMVVVDDACLVR
jgi:hypothetical protein